MLQIYPLVAHVIFHENPVKYRFFCIREDIVKLGLALFPLLFEGQRSFRTVFYHAFQMRRRCLQQDTGHNLSVSPN